MDIRTLKPFDKVRIKDDGSIWDGRIAIVDRAEYGMIWLSNCIDPQNQYIVGIWNANNIEPLN